jgi:hypothetical protein
MIDFSMVETNTSIDRMDVRIERIERRLDLTDA